MPGPLPIELRERVIEAVDNGEGTHEEIAERFGVKRRALQSWLRLREETGSLAPRAMGGAREGIERKVDAAGEQFIRETLEAKPALTLKQLSALYHERTGVTVAPRTLSDTVRRLGFTFKRGPAGRKPLGGLMWCRRERRSAR